MFTIIAISPHSYFDRRCQKNKKASGYPIRERLAWLNAYRL
jgi:hypothetical protein